MRRRKFLATAGVVGAGAVVPREILLNGVELGAPAGAEYYDLRTYRCASGQGLKIVEDFWSKALLPACGRIGIGPVGAFKATYGPDSGTLLVLLTHKTLESAASATSRLLDDAEVMRAGADYFAAPIDKPPFVRMSSRLLMAMKSMPQLVVPELTRGKQQRILELRTYDSHNERAGKLKVDMINEGEVEFFRRNGAPAVFAAQTIFGEGMPSLSYMLVFPDLAARDAGWAGFRKDPDWVKLSARPEYQDLVSNVSDWILRPTA
ncbi:MAG TPA: NIPSNAP family protein, partial [Gemmatimonadaceae bacterium]